MSPQDRAATHSKRTSIGEKEEQRQVPSRESIENFDPGRLLRLLHAGLLANSFLLIGGIMFLAFFTREVITCCQRDRVADGLYWTGFACFFLSGCIEFYIDVVWTRSYAHGRYSTNRSMNIVISALFLLGTVVDVIAFIFWRNGEIIEHYLQYASTHVFLITAILVMISNRPKLTPFLNRLDTYGNLFFSIETVLMCVARYVTNGEFDPVPYAMLNLELVASAFWVCSAISYIMADVVRLQNPTQTVQQEAEEHHRRRSTMLQTHNKERSNDV